MEIRVIDDTLYLISNNRKDQLSSVTIIEKIDCLNNRKFNITLYFDKNDKRKEYFPTEFKLIIKKKLNLTKYVTEYSQSKEMLIESRNYGSIIFSNGYINYYVEIAYKKREIELYIDNFKL
jgi:hypothetical protein